MEAGEHGLTRGTCFVASRLEVVAVAGLLRISWCVLGAAGYFRVFAFRFIFFKRTRPAASMRPPCLIYLSTSIPSDFAKSDCISRPIFFSDRNIKIRSSESDRIINGLIMRPFFAFRQKGLSIPGCVQGGLPLFARRECK